MSQLRILILLGFGSSLLLSCGGEENIEATNIEQKLIEDTLTSEDSTVNESELYVNDEPSTPHDELVKKFKTSGQDLNFEDMVALRAMDESDELNPPFTIGYHELEHGHVLVYGLGFIADAVHLTGGVRLAYYKSDGTYRNTILTGVIDDYDLFKIQDNFIGLSCEYMEFEEGEYTMESTGNTIYEIEYFAESSGELVVLNEGTKDLDVWRNQIFAKHGYIFKNEKYTNIFNDFTWYKPKHDNVDHLLSPEEKALVKYIRELENK